MQKEKLSYNVTYIYHIISGLSTGIELVLNNQLRGSSLRKTISPDFSIPQSSVVFGLGLRHPELSPFHVNISISGVTVQVYLGSHACENSWV